MESRSDVGAPDQIRKKDPSALKAELQFLLDNYPTSFFAFMDNDIAANDFFRLEKMLEELIDLRRNRNIQCFCLMDVYPQ